MFTRATGGGGDAAGMRLSRLARLAGALLLLGGVSVAYGQAAPIDTDVVRLTPDEREAALEAGALRAAREPPINGLSRGVHGEIGTEFGTHGTRALYGTAVVPLGETGSAAFSFLTDRSNGWRPR